MEISSIMRKVVVAEKEITIKEAAKIMSSKNVGSIVVVEGDKILGIITERDILRNMDKQSEQIKKLMSKDVITISPNQEVDEAKEIMIRNKIKRLPVIEDKKIVGIVKITDVLANITGDIDEPFLLS
jgi:CBS domain-containing protein